jgi:hypothetical protein
LQLHAWWVCVRERWGRRRQAETGGDRWRQPGSQTTRPPQAKRQTEAGSGAKIRQTESTRASKKRTGDTERAMWE